MSRTVLVQCPQKFQEIIPIFSKECLKHGIFDDIYIATDSTKKYDLDKRCHIIRLKKDNQFASNILHALDQIKESRVLLCCEDHIPLADHCRADFDLAYDFFDSNSRIGYLRLTNNKKVLFEKKSDYKSEKFGLLSRKYKYYISLQPAIWNTNFLRAVLRPGEDAWITETSGSKRASAANNWDACCAKEDIFKATNFFKSGKYIRHYFADYVKDNGLDLQNSMEVFVKKDGNKIIKTIEEYANENRI